MATRLGVSTGRASRSRHNTARALAATNSSRRKLAVLALPPRLAVARKSGIPSKLEGWTLRSITGQTLAARFESRYAVIVHGDTHPTASDWARIVEAYRETLERDKLRVLVYTHGGAPAAHQRAEVNRVFGQSYPRIAVLTSSVLARVVAKAVQLVARELRIFDANQIEAALDHLQLYGPDRASARSTLESLRHEFATRSSSRTP